MYRSRSTEATVLFGQCIDVFSLKSRKYSNFIKIKIYTTLSSDQ